MTEEIDENGYKRRKNDDTIHSNLTHRQMAFKEIYLPNQEKYPLPFSHYQIHHIDQNKQNNNILNLELLTKEEHRAKHGLSEEQDETEDFWQGTQKEQQKEIYQEDTPNRNLKTILFKRIILKMLIFKLKLKRHKYRYLIELAIIVLILYNIFHY